MARQLSLHKLALRMQREARRRHEAAAAVSSLKCMISKWEHDRIAPDEYNRRLLAASLSVTVEELGLTKDPDFVW